LNAGTLGSPTVRLATSRPAAETVLAGTRAESHLPRNRMNKPKKGRVNKPNTAPGGALVPEQATAAASLPSVSSPRHRLRSPAQNGTAV